jgi:hypothetical protein
VVDPAAPESRNPGLSGSSSWTPVASRILRVSTTDPSPNATSKSPSDPADLIALASRTSTPGYGPSCSRPMRSSSFWGGAITREEVVDAGRGGVPRLPVVEDQDAPP